MTLCIAAACREYAEDGPLGGEERVVLAHDHRVETWTFSAETEYKFDYLHNHWVALLAGTVSQARELMDIYRPLFRKVEFTDENCLENLRKPPAEMRRRMANAYTHARHAISYEEFLKNGKCQLPDDLYRQTAEDISRLQINAELILVGYFLNAFHIFRFSNGEILPHPDFATIGSGSHIADSSLYQREHQKLNSVASAAYSVYEAKRLGEIAPGVGKKTTYSILVPPVNPEAYLEQRQCSAEVGEAFLQRQFKQFGPRAFKESPLPEHFWI